MGQVHQLYKLLLIKEEDLPYKLASQYVNPPKKNSNNLQFWLRDDFHTNLPTIV